jgi:polyketide synthase PksJ
LRGFYEPDPTDAIEACRSYSKWGSFLDGFAEFDPEFFGISRFDALSMDPQERIFLQVAWQAIEDAAHTRERFASDYKSNVGVFVGMSKTGFELYGPPAWKRSERFFPRTSFSSVANRISYLFNLTGPSLAVDTMCSSSLP